MDNVKSFFDSFKEFIWDIIGYLLPGSYVFILFSVCVNQNYFLTLPSGVGTDFLPYVYVVISYLLGHAIYGLSWFKENTLRRKRSYTKKIEEEIKKRKAFVLSKQLLAQALAAKGITDDLSTATVRDVRSIVMSFIPEQDQKIYTFTFRSDLANQIGNVSIIVGLLGLLCSIFKNVLPELFKNDPPQIFLYIVLIISYIFLRQTRNRFYAISIGLPFSIYTANAIKQ